MNISSDTQIKTAFVCALSAHPAAEAIRRFIFYSNTVYAVADILVFLAAIIAFRISKPKNVGTPLFLFSIYVLWGFLCLLIDQSSPMLLIVGLRPLIMAACAYIIAASYFRVADAPLITMLHTITFWVVLTFSVGLLQLYSGIDADINHLLDASLDDEMAGGRGNYTLNDEALVEGFFRPTSIFMHTGRLGQFTFMTTLLLWVTALLSENRIIKATWPAVIAGFLVLLSGQRAAFLFLVIAVLWLLSKSGNTLTTVRLGLACIFFTLPITLFMSDDAIDLISGRFLSVFGDSGSRAKEQSSGILVALEHFPLFGKGIGFFTFGSKPYGGDVFYEYMSSLGGSGGENSWIRIQGETGLPGLFAFVLLIGFSAAHPLKRFRISRLEEGRILHFVAGYAVIALSAWALTHDVFGNYLMMMQLFFFIGASSGYWVREKSTAVKLRVSNV